MDGKAEERMGKAISQGGRRDKIFLMTKCCGRTAKDAQSNLEDSLRRLRTDHLDLWQFHEINYDNDPDWGARQLLHQQTRTAAVNTRICIFQGNLGRFASMENQNPRARPLHGVGGS